MHWKTKIYRTASDIADQFSKDARIHGVAIGGSIGRGETWKHSDLELCILVEDYIDEFQYFNFIQEMGVEIIQLKKDHIVKFIETDRIEDLNILDIPIQIYKCKINYDPLGLLHHFKRKYDSLLFHESIRKMKADEALLHAGNRLTQAKEVVQTGHYKTALAHLRIGLNDLLLGTYWKNGILPRSQSRAIYLLKNNSTILGHDKLYHAFLQIYCLSNYTEAEMKNRFLKAREDILKLAEENWGTNSSEFLSKAVDSNFEWGHAQSVVYVYKWCVHLLHGKYLENKDNYEKLSSIPLQELNAFLDMYDIDLEQVNVMIQLYEEAFHVCR